MWLIVTFLIGAAAAALAARMIFRRRFAAERERSQAAAAELKSDFERQAALVQTQQQALFNSMVEGVLLLDHSGRVRIANRAFAELFDIKPDVRGRMLLEVVRQHELSGLLHRVADEKQVLEFELNDTGLPERRLQVNAALVSNGGEKQGVVLVFRDVTRLKQLERTREEFVANVSHELRTPLSLIKGYTETLLEGAKDDPEITTRFLQTIQRNSERLQFLIEDLLTISELESGRITMNAQPAGLHALVDRVFEELRMQASARKVTLANEVDEHLAVFADADRMVQVLANLVGNAIKYGREEGTVRVQATRGASACEVCVRDDGPGIPREALARVFERFYRVDKARSREQGGTGLGLSIVKHIVQSHGGKVWAASEPGKGAAFYFTLPHGG